MEVGILQKEMFNMERAEERAKERAETDEGLRTLAPRWTATSAPAMIEKTEAKVRAYHALSD